MIDSHLEPVVNQWEEYTKPEFIKDMIFEFCEDITMRGANTSNKEIYWLLYDYLDENIDKYYPENDNINEEI